MVSILKKAIVTTLFITASVTASAVPAKPGLIPMTQPDGSVINVRIHGDEFHHFYTTEDGYLLINDNDTYYYGNVDSRGIAVRSDIVATPAAARSQAARDYLAGVDMNHVRSTMQLAAEARTSRMAQTQKIARPAFASSNGAERGYGLFPDDRFPGTGHQKGLVILVQYTDVKFTLTDPYDYFHRMLNEPGFSSYSGTGSAVDFFRESSMDQFIPEFDVFGPITLSKNMAYYGGNGYSGDDQHPGAMVVEACQQLDNIIDFTEYDRDGDGYVDNVFVFYAGRGEASGGSADTVWPHSWTVQASEGTMPVHDGVRVNRYACSNEWEGSRPDGVGTFVHEFSHVMGLPDLYATSYTSSFTPGSWSCMDYGPYNNNGCTPPIYAAFERYALGWMEPMEIKGAINAVLPNITTNKAGIVKTAKDTEFFLFENRQQTGWDEYVPGHGMLIWHVDYNSSVWSSNKVNNTPSHQYVDIEEADGTQTESSRNGDPFPGMKNVTSFTDTTNPSMKTWSGQGQNKPITEIAEKNGIITFKACGGRTEELEGTTALEPEEVSDDSFTALWEPKPESEYLLSVYQRDDAGTVTYLPGYDHCYVGTVTSWKVEGLEAGETYYYTVAVSTGWEQTSESNEIAVVTGDLPLNKYTVETLEAGDVSETGFTARWNLIPLANDYILSVYTKEPTGNFHSAVDFTDGVAKLPAGWTANTSGSYAMVSYSGAAIPSLRMGKTSDMICSPLFDDDVKSVTFWHRGNGSGAGDILEVSALVDNAWKLVAEVPVNNAAGGTVTTVEVPFDGARQAKITLQRNSGKGAVAIDDIDVAHGVDLEDTPVEGLAEKSLGNVAEHAVTGLQPATEYYYKVYATDGTLTSRISPEVKVKTAGNPQSGIVDVVAPDVKFTVSGLTVTAPAEVTVYDLMGRTIGRGTTVTLPARGVYIVAGKKVVI